MFNNSISSIPTRLRLTSMDAYCPNGHSDQAIPMNFPAYLPSVAVAIDTSGFVPFRQQSETNASLVLFVVVVVIDDDELNISLWPSYSSIIQRFPYQKANVQTAL